MRSLIHTSRRLGAPRSSLQPSDGQQSIRSKSPIFPLLKPLFTTVAGLRSATLSQAERTELRIERDKLRRSLRKVADGNREGDSWHRWLGQQTDLGESKSSTAAGASTRRSRASLSPIVGPSCVRPKSPGA